ncbi:radical SAM family heme chaperone HemW [Candidatus Spongiihabitans sp.]|uniref:radical SAM family heme chaperone HemW n=1 Tax=Candidatus Spongiihabitans sp. TaxID=3101308 RepID=UPI003C7DCA9C
MLVPPLSLYIHFPWCIKKCPYCDFNSHALKGALDAEQHEEKYIRALIADLDADLDDAGFDDNVGAATKDRKLISIFMGGGTPSLFSAKSFSTLLHQIKRRIEFDANIEITLEANPGTLEHDQFEAYLASGINRLSLGVQSFDDRQLKTLGRIHDADAAENAIQAAKAAGFENFNLDLMYGLPDQTAAAAVQDCLRAISHSPAHLSFYQLTIEPNTFFYHCPPRLPDDDQQIEIQTALQNTLNQCGYRQYEVSAYSIAGRECKHNLNYWQFGDYLGIGTGAHSKLTVGERVVRSWKQKHPETYMAHIENNTAYKTQKPVPQNQLLFEFMMNALRLKAGIKLTTLQQRTGLSKNSAVAALQHAINQKWVEITDETIRCTEPGYLFIDEILQHLLPES